MIRFPKNSSSFLVAAGTHPAICYCVAELGTQETSYGKKPQIHIGWELPEEPLPNGRPAVVRRRYAVSADPKSALRTDIESWEGRRFSAIDLDAFDIADLIGQTCLLSVQHSDEVGGRIYANVASVLPPPRGMAKRMQTHNDPIVFELEHESARAMYAALPEWLRTTISRSPEYQQRFGATAGLSGREAGQHRAAPAMRRQAPALVEAPVAELPDDDVNDAPFDFDER